MIVKGLSLPGGQRKEGKKNPYSISKCVFIIFSSVDEHPGCFHFLAIVNKAPSG